MKMATKTKIHKTCKIETYSKPMFIKNENNVAVGELKCIVIPNRPENGFHIGNYFVSKTGYEFYVINGYHLEAK